MLRVSYLLILLLTLALPISCTDNYSRFDFPPGFVFGAGTSNYQVEGAANEDGRTPGIWDTYTHSGKFGGETGDVAVDEYHKYKEDVKLMVETGLDAYRFSISWPRLIPNGRGAVNPKGIQYYNNLIDELISHGIQPHVTIYHFDHPQVLEDEYGGWLSRKIVRDFRAYAGVCFREFGDRVKHWTTLNEANVIPNLGYDVGVFPPNRCSVSYGLNCTKGNSSTEPYLVAHHIILAHAAAVRLYKQKYQKRQLGSIGINLLIFGNLPLTNSTEDVLATRRANDFLHGLILNPLVFGDYPEIVKKTAGSRLPIFTNLESKLVKGTIDFLGINQYFSVQVIDFPASLYLKHRDYLADIGILLAAPNMTNASDAYPIDPSGMKAALEYLKQEYPNPPIYIHENGQRTPHTPSLDDTPRVKYLQSYIGSVLDAIRNGSNTRGYFTWSFLDLFEFWGGYEMSYGLYYVDMEDPDLKRYPKLSAHWYSQFLKGGTVSSDADAVIQLPFNIPSATRAPI